MENNWPCSKNRQELRVVSHKLFPLNLLLGTDYPCWVFSQVIHAQISSWGVYPHAIFFILF